MSFKIIKQHDIKDCGAACLSMISTHYGLKLPMAKYRDLIKVDNHGASIYGIVKGAEKIGLKAEALYGEAQELSAEIGIGRITTPFIARVIIDGILEHFVVVYKATNSHFYIADPGDGKKKYTYNDFFEIWTGHIVTFEPTDSFEKKNERRGSFIKFFKLVLCRKRLLAAIFACSVIISAIGIAGAFLLQAVVDYLGNQGFLIINSVGLPFFFGVMATMYVFQALMSFLRGYFVCELSKRADASLMLDFYNHICDLPMHHLNNRKTGEILSRFNDAGNIKDAVSGAALTVVLDVLMVCVCVVVLVLLNPTLFLISFFTVCAYALVVIMFVKPMKKQSEALMSDNAEVTSYIKETVDGIETVKAYGAESMIKSKTADKYNKLLSSAWKSSMLSISQDALSELVASVGVIALLYIGTCLSSEGIITVGTLLTFYSLLGYFMTPVQGLVNLQPEMQTALVAADRLGDLLDLEKESDAAENCELSGDIKIQNIDFRYGNRQLVLKDVSLEIKQGESVALVGESGSGKTTLAKLIMAFYEPEKGCIEIGNTDISMLSPVAVRKNIAYISQDVFLFSDTIKNNLVMGNDSITDSELEWACSMSGSLEFIKKSPMGFGTLLGENGLGLSAGQKQRLAIARALLKHPQILIMDEATCNLDTITERQIKNVIELLKGSVTFVIIAHRLSTVKDCDRIYVMKDGEIIQQGSHEVLVNENGLYKRLWEENL